MSQRPRPFLPRLAAVLLALTGAAPCFAAPVINEIMARPGSGFPENTALEFIEIHNPDTTAATLSGWRIAAGPDFTFPAGTSLPAGGFIVVAADPAALRAAGAAGTVVGPWKTGATLSNRGETLTLARADGTVVDSIDYAHEGDWATRTRDALGGWSWVTPANDGGRSFERRNPRLAVAHGHNWGASSAAGGTPGAANSLRTADIAPAISAVRHAPAVPRSNEAVTITARVADESPASALAVTLHWRNATTASPGAFQGVAMSHLGDGLFGVGLGALPDKAIVEFYVAASDGTNTRTWPAPTSEGQNANAAYQVDDEGASGSAAVYRLVLTAAENAAFTAYSAGQRPGDRTFNVTLVASRGEDTAIRYLASMRVRGNSSRNYTIKPLRISLPSDARWEGVTDFMINSRGAPVQFLAHRIQRAAGLVAADASPVDVRRQGVKYSVATGSAADHGRLVRLEEFDGDYLDNHFPLAASAQLYRKVATSNWAHTAAAPANPDLTWSGWSKQNNGGANNWADVMAFSKVWQDTAAPYFTGAAAGNVAAGTWNGTPFSDADVAALGAVADLDYLARWLAVQTIMPNGEPNLSTGEDDDYAAAFVSDGTRTRMYPLPHDMDTTFGLGEVAVSATASGLYDATEAAATGGGGQPGANALMEPLLPLLGDSTRPGHAGFRQKYLTAIRELFGTVFDADTAGGAVPAFHRFVDNHLDWTPASYRTSIKTFMTQRQSHLLGLIGAAKIAPAAATGNATAAAATTPALRINEVLAANTRFANGGTFPDLIELHNAGTAPVNLAGLSLTDDPAEPRKYVFPAGTTLAAGGYLVVYADTATSAPGLHTGFSLDAEGDTVRLHDTAAAGGALLDSVVFGFQIPDHAVARTGTGGAVWALATPTPAAANGAALAVGAPAAVKLNEWAGRVEFRVDHDFVELHNASAQPVALGGVRLTDDPANYPARFAFPPLSFIAAGGFLPLYGADFGFGLDADFDQLFLLGANGAPIDGVSLIAQPADQSTARTPDSGDGWTTLAVPTPGIANATALPAGHAALLAHLRITEVMYQPTGGGDYEWIELRNIGPAPLDLGGVRFTNGLDYTFAAGTTLAAGAYTVVAKDRGAFLSRYPSAAGVLAAGAFSGALDNNGENIALTLPAPWYVHIVRFRYESTWQPLTAGNGYALAVRAPATTAVRLLGTATSWRASAAANGSPGTADSSTVALTLAQPTVLSAPAGSATTLAVRASAGGGITYRWQRLLDGVWTDIPGATTASYTLASTQAFDAGTYRVLVTADGETLASDTTVLTVVAATGVSATRLVNLSTRAQQTAANPVVPGFVLGGTGTKRLLIRAVGPTLAAFGVGSALADPNLTLKRYNAATAAYDDVLANDNWGAAANAATLATVTATAGGFALPAGSADAALLVDLAPGQYTAVTGATGDGTGVALIELYDTDTAAPTARLANIATRAFVGTADAIMAAGFVIAGDGTKTLLIRAVGPALTAFGVGGALADPQLAIFRGPDAILANDDWAANPAAATTAATAARVGAFALPAAGKDSAFVVTLPAGAYTVQVNGAAGTTGVALVEVYEVP